MRMVSVWLPHLPIERLKRERQGERFPDELPFALVGSEDGALLLTAVNGAAARKGLYPCLPLADARAIHPSLLTAPAEPAKDAASLIALARWSRRFSPSLNTDGTDGLWLDVTGVPHLFGGEEALLDDLAARLARFGFSTNLAIADTLGGAHALARYGRSSPIAVPRGKIAQALAPLPVEALRLADEPVRLLKRLGLKRIGQLYDLPRASLERRFHSRDAAEAVLLRLDQALGRREETLAPLRLPSEFVARLPFPEPLITHEGIVASLDRLAVELQAQLEAAARGARRLKLTLTRADGSAAVVQAGLSAPSRKAFHLASLLSDKLAAIDAGFGIDLMMLAAPVTETLPPAQASFAGNERRESQEALIDRLASRLSEGAVQRLYAAESHLPERAQEIRTAFGGLPAWQGRMAPKPQRPPLLLAQPEPLSVLAEVPEGPPVRFTWRRVTRAVVKAEGPERIAPEWWLALVRRSGASDLNASPLEGEADRSSIGREGGRPQTPSLPLTPLPGPPPQGGRGSWGAAANSNPSPPVGEGGGPDIPSGTPGEGDCHLKAPPTRVATQADLSARERYEKNGGTVASDNDPHSDPPPFRGREAPRTRDYYRIEDDEGRRYWVFREGLYQEKGATPAWYLHGVFG